MVLMYYAVKENGHKTTIEALPTSQQTPTGYRWATYEDVAWFQAMGGALPDGATVRGGIGDEAAC